MFKVEIRECSKELSAKERVMLKDVSNCESINELAEQAKELPAMIVSGGRIGSQIELSPEELCSAANAEFADIIMN